MRGELHEIAKDLDTELLAQQMADEIAHGFAKLLGAHASFNRYLEESGAS